ncbi:MAG: hypothetical protein HYZ01_03470 [Ignavibacteriales bacterium]|nr:hypothetical protein [Ignavibacteriales bacterium]
MPTPEFKTRLKRAIQQVIKDRKLIEPRSFDIYTFAKCHKTYDWHTVQNVDGLLLTKKTVRPIYSNQQERTAIIAGLIIQSEYTTADTKPNPQGKAAVSEIATGVWFSNSESQILRIDSPRVLFILPKGSTPDMHKRFETTRTNVNQAVALFPNSIVQEVNRGISAKALARKLKKQLSSYLRTVGKSKTIK